MAFVYGVVYLHGYLGNTLCCQVHNRFIHLAHDA